MKDVVKKQFENAPKRKDDEKSHSNHANNRINMTNFNLTFPGIKLSFKLSLKIVELK